MKKAAILGGGYFKEEDEEYKLAKELGEMLTLAGYQVVNGGYGGVMQASGEGALKAGGQAIGYTLDQKPDGNRFVKSQVAGDFFDRLRALMQADIFFIFPGREGTCIELMTCFYKETLAKKLGEEKKCQKIFLASSGMLSTNLNYSPTGIFQWENIEEIIESL